MISPVTKMVSELSTPFIELTPSMQVKCVAERFISTLSTASSPPNWPTSHDVDLISPEELETLEVIMTSEIAKNLKSGKPDGPFYEIGRGFSHVAWGHPTYPNIVIKLMDQEGAETQLRVGKKALEVTQEMNNCWVQIPRASSISVGKITAYIEERLPIGLTVFQHKEFWARILIHYQSFECSDLFKANLQTLTCQIQLLIERVGFWDVGPHNLPEVRIDGTGVCGIDFERINLDPEVNRTDGLEQLACLVPIAPLVNNVIALVTNRKHQAKMAQYGHLTRDPQFRLPESVLEETCQDFHLQLKDKKEGLRVLQDAIQIYDERGYENGDEEILSCCDLSSLNKLETQLAQGLLGDITKELSKKKGRKMSLTEKRHLYVEPHNPCYKREHFVKALNVLKEQNIVVSWAEGLIPYLPYHIDIYF